MKVHQLFVLSLFVLVPGCANKGCCVGEKPAEPDAGPPPVVAEDCGEALKLCLSTVRQTERNVGVVNQTRTHCANLEAGTFNLDARDLAAIAAMGKDAGACTGELEACEDIRSRGVKVLQSAVKALDRCNEDLNAK